jgi:hypothetical protein
MASQTNRTAQLAAALSSTPVRPARARRPLQTRKPTGQVSWPVILVEGGEGTGKTYAMAELTADPRVGRAFWFDLGEGSADEFGAVGDYEIVGLDGTWADLIDQLYNVIDVAEAAHAAGEPPVVLCIDSITAVWGMCSGWAQAKAASSRAAKKALAEDPDADINIGPLVWTNAANRWYSFFRPLKMSPMIVAVAAKAADTVAIENGKPVQGKTVYKIKAQRDLPYDVNAIVRLAVDQPPTVTKCRSPKWSLRPGIDPPRKIRDLSLAKLIFDGMGFDPGHTQIADQVELEMTPEIPDANDPVETESQDPQKAWDDIPVAQPGRAA